MEFHLFQDKAGRWRWVLLAPNRMILAESVHDYSNPADCRASLEQFRGASLDTPIFED